MKTDAHAWVPVLFRQAPALKCLQCGFIWQTHMQKPKASCDDVLRNRKRFPTIKDVQ